MKNPFKRFARLYAVVAEAFIVLKSNLLNPAFPHPAYQRVTIPVSQPKAIRYSRRG